MANTEGERIQHQRDWNDIPVYCPVTGCEAVIHRYDVDTANGNWLLSFVCEDHHHWVVEVGEDSGSVASTVRRTGCPNPAGCYFATEPDESNEPDDSDEDDSDGWGE